MPFLLSPSTSRRRLLSSICFFAALAALALSARAAATIGDGFNPNVNGTVNVLAVQADGKILVGGGFTGLQPTGSSAPAVRNNVARLNPDGTLDTSFDPEANGAVLAMAV